MIELPRPPQGGPGLDEAYRGMVFRADSPIVSMEPGDHDHCYSCSSSMCGDLDDHCLHTGYVSPDDGFDVWLCEPCFELYREPLNLRIEPKSASQGAVSA